MAEISKFRHRRRENSKVHGAQPQLPVLPWLSTAVLIGLAAAWFFPYGLGREVVAGFGDFQYCASAQQQNCVIDGDTVRYNGLSIRLEDIDAPETRKYKCASEAALGRRATQRLRELMNAGPFQVVYTGGRDEDRYGRKLRVIERDGRSFGATLVAEGLARPWDGARRSWCG